MGTFLLQAAGAIAHQAPVAVHHPGTIDFSQLDTLVGLLVGASVVGGLGLIILWFAFKFGVLTFSNKKNNNNNNNIQQGMGFPPGCSIHQLCPEHIAEKERSMANVKAIDALWRKFDSLAIRFDGYMENNRVVQNQLLLGMVRGGFLPDSALSLTAMPPNKEG